MTSIREAMATLGETLVPILLALVIAALSTIGGFFGYFAFCDAMFTSEGFESAVALAPLAAIVVGIAVFVVVLRWVVRYSKASSDGA